MKQDRRLPQPGHIRCNRPLRHPGCPRSDHWLVAHKAQPGGTAPAQDSGRFLIRQESPKSFHNGLPSGDGNTHGMFLDRMNGLVQPTSPGNDSAVKSNNQTGQSTAAALRAADTDRLGNFEEHTVCPNRHLWIWTPWIWGRCGCGVMMNDPDRPMLISGPSMESWGRDFAAGTVPGIFAAQRRPGNGHVARHRGSAAAGTGRYCVVVSTTATAGSPIISNMSQAPA